MLKKDWDCWVINDEKKFVAKDIRGGRSVALGKFSRHHATMPFDRADYKEFQLDPTVVQWDISQLLELPSKKDLKKQGRCLKGKELED